MAKRKFIRMKFKQMPLHIQIIQEPLAGFAAENSATGNSKLKVVTRGILHSDQIEFYDSVKQISQYYIEPYFIESEVTSFLVIDHKDKSTDIYINQLPIVLGIIHKSNSVANGEMIYHHDIADIDTLHFQNIVIKNDDTIMFCFKKGWKFGLFFDFNQLHEGNNLNVDELAKTLGNLYKYLAFQEEYSILENNKVFNEMVEDGWFPFVQLLGGKYKELSKAYNFKGTDTFHFDNQINSVIDKFNEEKLKTLSINWSINEVYLKKKEILDAGIEAYLTHTKAGYINCIKTLYSEIEGIIRISYFNEHGKNPKFAELVKYVETKGLQKFSSANSLGLPDIFYQYLNEIIFKNFNLNNSEVDLSRHTNSHGVANSEDYTKTRAFQAILIIDQMFFFLR